MSPPDSTASGPQIDGFELHERIGTGGFSSVYRASESSMGRDVAVKVLHTDFSTEADRRVFERECRALGLLARHPNIVTVYSATVTTDGRACIVMELYADTLRDRLDHGPLEPAAVLDLGVKMAGALQAAHDGGVLHRDIKPHNIFMSEYGEPALGDFGISSVDDERSISAASGLSVAYAAPEVLEDGAATVSSDVYSLAATLFHLVQGTAPFASPQLRTTVRKILTEEPPGVSAASPLPHGFDGVLRRNLAKDPADRAPTARDFGEQLRRVQIANGLTANPVVTMRTSGPGAGHAAPSGSVGTGEFTVARAGGGTEPAAPAQAPPSSSMRDPRRKESVPAQNDELLDLRGTGERTVVRSSVGADLNESGELEGVEPTGAGVHRRRAAVGLAGLALLGAAGLGVMATSGNGDEQPVATDPVSVDDDATVDGDVFFEFVDPPSDVAVSVLDDGTVQLSFAAVAGALGYEAESRPPSAVVGEVRSEVTESPAGSVIATGLAAEDAPCWVVRAIGDGRRSRDTPLACVGI